MLGWLVKTTVGTLREAYNAAESTIMYVADEIASIPDAIKEGWDEGLSTKEAIPPVENEPKKPVFPRV